ncbi:MAG: hypothetical protein IPK89_10415 [Sphingomonadales bacterium]|nr:hypothetical protein [Sphingomonadales bacterium]
MFKEIVLSGLALLAAGNSAQAASLADIAVRVEPDKHIIIGAVEARRMEGGVLVTGQVEIVGDNVRASGGHVHVEARSRGKLLAMRDGRWVTGSRHHVRRLTSGKGRFRVLLQYPLGRPDEIIVSYETAPAAHSNPNGPNS